MEKKANIVASVRQKLLNISQQRCEDPNLVFIRYAIERFLYRLSCSEQSRQFILKGAMLWAIWTKESHRPTKDLDLLGFGDTSDETIEKIIKEICEVDVEPDGLTLYPETIQLSDIREELDYPGKRVKLESRLGNAKIHIQIDIGFGDSIVPTPNFIDYPTLLDMPSPNIRTYPIETFIAEKVETIVSKGMPNSRMKDFYDLQVLSQRFDFDGSIVADAIQATFNRRGTAIPDKMPIAFTEEFHNNSNKQIQWQAFIKANKLDDTKLDFSTTIDDLIKFLMPLLRSVAANEPFNKKWINGGSWE